MKNWPQGSWDIHVHAAPSLFERWGTAWQTAQVCQQANMEGIVLKYHHGSTVELASLLQDQFPKLTIFGGTTLNYFVGGLNPYAIDAAIRLGGKIIWLPTIHAANHGAHVGPLGGFSFQGSKISKTPEKGITIFNEQKELLEPMKEILSLLNNKPITLSSGHISYEEIMTLVRYIEKNNLKMRLMIGHISFKAPALTINQLKELVKDWIWFEDSYISLTPLANCTTAKEMAERLMALPNARWILSTDSGQKNNLKSPDAIDDFASKLIQQGVPEKMLERMLSEEPRNLLRS